MNPEIIPLNPEIIPLVLACVVCAVIVFVAWDSGLIAWARRGCPDYNEPPKTPATVKPNPAVTRAIVKQMLDARDAEIDAECAAILQRWGLPKPEARHPDFQQGFLDDDELVAILETKTAEEFGTLLDRSWPRDTGTKP